MTLTFDLPVRPGFDTMTVIGSDGNSWQDGAAVVDGNTVSIRVRPLGPAGRYQVGYRIVSDDGHPVTGSVTFALTTAGTGTPGAQGSAAAAPAGAADDASGTPAWPWIVGAVALVEIGVVVALRVGRT